MIKSLSLFLCMILVSSVNADETNPLAHDDATIKHGKEVFMENCIACHGVKGDGKGPAAVAIPGAKPRDFTAAKFKYGSQDKDLFKTITNGSEGTAMPSWSALSETDRWSVIHYLRTLKKSK
jgi:cytochrome c oxidase cbb3-type subunit I/II